MKRDSLSNLLRELQYLRYGCDIEIAYDSDCQEWSVSIQHQLISTSYDALRAIKSAIKTLKKRKEEHEFKDWDKAQKIVLANAILSHLEMLANEQRGLPKEAQLAYLLKAATRVKELKEHLEGR